ncbi:MAG TPA: dihydrolipoyl dehydrogenase [Halobacteriales archaeon]|nr:dihydrolipoyl dehydrogenase [Halobacteriales archaeon]
MVVGDISTGTDVLVIGGGPAGYTAAIRAGQLDLDVTLVEKRDLGGSCLNRGCVPSKALLSGTKLAHEGSHAEELGIEGELSVDLGAMVDWKDGVVDQLTGGVAQLCDSAGVNVMEGTAFFSGEHEARVMHGGEGEGSEAIEFEHAIVATGSRPIEIPGFSYDDEPVLDSAHALALREPPERLVVVGAGYIGMELSTVFARLGTEVTVVEMLDDVLPGFESRLARPVTKRADGLGVEFHFGQAASEWRYAAAAAEGQAEVNGGSAGDGESGESSAVGDGIVVVTEDEDGETYEYPADAVLVAVGREPVTDTLELGNVGLEPNDDGFLETDDQARTAVDHVFAVGDVAGEPMLAHKGMMEGEVAAEVVAGEPVGLDYQAIPAAVFTDPEIATVGMTEAEAEEAGFTPAVGTFPFGASGRALSTGHTDGFVRIVADEESGFVLGGQIVGPEASELVAELGLAIEMGATLEDLAATIHTHPTLSEAVMEAAENALGHAIHTLNR